MQKTDEQKIKEVLTRGVEEVIIKSDLEEKLLSGKRLKVYYGIDPTGSYLHLGHAVVLWKLKDFQDLGHEVILLIGDFTAKIGDPTGRDIMRTPLTDKQIKENMKDYKKQASKILDFSKVKIKHNSQWLSKLKFNDILKISSYFTVQQMLHRDMFDKKIKENTPISLQEFMYPLMQGYDSVAMDVDLEIAGSDQMFNMLAGRILQKIYHKKDKNILTTKILLGTDGRKMSKTYNNAIYLNDSAKDMYGKIMSINDEMIGDYIELCLSPIGNQQRLWETFANPRDRKAGLAKEITGLYHGEKEAQKAEDEFNKTFRDKKPTFIEFSVDEIQIFYPELISRIAGVTTSEAKRLIIAGAVEINGVVDKEWKKEIDIDENGVEIKVGKRDFIKVKLN